MRTFVSDTNFRTSVKLSKQRRGGDDELQVGYVEFGDVDVTEKAYGDGNIRVDGETKALHYAKRKEMRRDRGVASAKRLFVSGIPSDTDKDELSRLLGDCKVSRSEKGKNFVFAEYESSEKKEEAMSRLNNMEFKSVKLFATPAYEKAAPSARPNKKRTDSD